MSNALSLLTDAETKRCVPDPEDSGFGALRTAKGNLPLESVDVRARITGLLSHVTLVQTFQNAHAEPLEATYVFPMPDRAAVTKFTLTVGGRVVEGLLKERGAARQEYDAAIQAGHRAAIAEEERPGTFTMRVGNLMPGEKASVHLEMTSPLLYEDGEATFRFPLVVAPRYIPGVPLAGGNVGDGTAADTDATPDASRITPPVLLPGFPNPVRLGLTVDVDAGGLTMGAIRSSLHAVTEDRKGEGLRRVTLGANERLNRDFILRMVVAEKDVKTALAVTPDAKGKGGTFAVTLVPPSPAALPVKPRDVVFVLDRSGSMDGWKMVAARRAMARMIDTLTANDRFMVYAFDDSIETPEHLAEIAMSAATDRNRYRAVEWLAKVESRGGTEMAQPLHRAVDQLNDGEPGRDRICVLVTDGQVGNEDQILQMLAPKLGGLRIFTVGIDRAVNEGFLKRLAAAGGGAFELVESEDRLDEAMGRIHRRIGTPVLTDLTIVESGAELLKNTVVPTRMPALFAGSPLTIGGRYLGSFAGKKMKLVARDATGRAWETEITPSSSANPAVAVVWARAWLRELEDQYVLSHDGALEKKIVDTSLQFGVLCRFTAFVAVDRAEVVNAGGRNVKQMQRVDAPEGWAMFDEDGEVDGGAIDEKVAPLAGKAAHASTPVMAKEIATELGEAAPMTADLSGLTGAIPKGMNGPARSASRTALGGGAAMKPPAPPKPSPAPVVAQPAKRKAPGLLGRLRGQKDEEAQNQAPPAEVIDLAPYRKRAKEILTLLEKAAPDHLLTLGSAAVQLAALVEDLESVGAPAVEVEPLKTLLATLREAVAKSNAGGRGGTVVPPQGARSAQSPAAAHAEALKTLRVFAEAAGAGGATPPRPEGARARSFWK